MSLRNIKYQFRKLIHALRMPPTRKAGFESRENPPRRGLDRSAVLRAKHDVNESDGERLWHVGRPGVVPPLNPKHVFLVCQVPAQIARVLQSADMLPVHGRGMSGTALLRPPTHTGQPRLDLFIRTACERHLHAQTRKSDHHWPCSRVEAFQASDLSWIPSHLGVLTD